MNFARMIVLGVAILTAGAAAFMVRSMSASQGEAVAALEDPTVNIVTKGVLVSTRPITVGESLIKEDFRWQDWPEESIHISFIVRTTEDASADKWIGAVVRSPVVVGEPLTAHKMVHIGSGGVMANIIEPGKRGLSIKISAASGAGGFILPNDRVDVIKTFKYRIAGSKADKFESETILTNVRVLAIDQTFREADGQQVVVGRTATLELTSTQVEEIALAGTTGSISLALRSLSNDGEGDEESVQKRKVKHQIMVVRNGRISGS